MTQTLYSSLVYEDATAAIAWLEAAFGFRPALVVPADDGTIVHAEMATASGERFMLLSTARSTRRNRSPRDLGGAAHALYMAVDDIDKAYARAQEAGAEVFNPLHDTDYGGREFCCFDVEGHIWTLGEYHPTGTED